MHGAEKAWLVSNTTAETYKEGKVKERFEAIAMCKYLDLLTGIGPFLYMLLLENRFRSYGAALGLTKRAPIRTSVRSCFNLLALSSCVDYDPVNCGRGLTRHRTPHVWEYITCM
jgi:hypothetical protein